MSWLISKALMNSLSLQEQEEGFFQENFSDGKQSAPLNGNLTPQAYCAPDKMTDFSRLSRFGMTFKPLTENLGEELLTLYLAGFHAKTLAQQEKAQELTENEAECGEKWHASFTKYDPDSFLWRTHQCSLLGDLEPFLETWPQWGLMRDGECWEQRTLEQTIRGTESGLSESWPTTRSCSAMAATITQESAWNEKRNPNLETIVGKRMFPTPDANCGQRGTQPNWTPKRKSGHQAQYTINQAVRDMEQNNGGKLNPMWVEWLMGWPLGWTDLKPLGMGKYPCARLPLGEF